MRTHGLVWKSPFKNARTVYVPLLSKLREWQYHVSLYMQNDVWNSRNHYARTFPSAGFKVNFTWRDLPALVRQNVGPNYRKTSRKNRTKNPYLRPESKVEIQVTFQHQNGAATTRSKQPTWTKKKYNNSTYGRIGDCGFLAFHMDADFCRHIAFPYEIKSRHFNGYLHWQSLGIFLCRCFDERQK